MESGIDELICKAEIETDVENKRVDTKGVRGGDGRKWKVRTDIHTALTLCIKQIRKGNLGTAQGTLHALW